MLKRINDKYRKEMRIEIHTKDYKFKIPCCNYTKMKVLGIGGGSHGLLGGGGSGYLGDTVISIKSG